MRVFAAQVAVHRPAVKIIGARRGRSFVLNTLGAAKFRAFLGMNRKGAAAGGHFAFAAEGRHARHVALFIHFHAKISGVSNGEGQVRRVHFVQFAFAQLANAEIDQSLGHAHLRRALIQIQEGQCRVAVQMDRGVACLQLGAGIFVHPDPVADGHRAVGLGVRPFTRTAGLHGNRSLHIADARHTCRWVALVGARHWHKRRGE